jgi:hypothetical protein
MRGLEKRLGLQLLAKQQLGCPITVPESPPLENSEGWGSRQ